MSIYHRRPNLHIGFHGCDWEVLQKLLNAPNQINASKEAYDWLGHGFYVWENNQERAMQWATDKKTRNKGTNPAVLGVVYTLENCLDFSDTAFIDMLAKYYQIFKADMNAIAKKIPTNKNRPNDQHQDLILRNLDCAVIEYLHQKISEKMAEEIAEAGYSHFEPFDTVRGIFTEGGPAFEGAGIQSKNHIQVCIRNFNCIKGFFLPRNEVKFP